VVASLDVLVREIEEIAEELTPSKLILGGFSQGAVMTLGVALRRPERLSGAMLLSGRHVPELMNGASPAASNLPFLIQHGIHDPVLDVANARTMRDALVRLGAPVEYHEYPMGHQVSWESLMDARKWLDRQITP
jgi:phospholipase/carboxylesterase